MKPLKKKKKQGFTWQWIWNKDDGGDNTLCYYIKNTRTSSDVFTVYLYSIWQPLQIHKISALTYELLRGQQERLAITLTGGNCWPADSKGPLEQLTVQTVGSWRCEVGNVSL